MNIPREVDINSIHEHPNYADVPRMRPDEWQEFYTDVAMSGIRVPIEVLADGTIVDGHSRFAAAQELGLAHVTIVDAPLNGDDPYMYMIKAAVLRRHLSDDQRSVMAARWAKDNRYSELHAVVQQSGERSPTRAKASNDFKVSRRKVTTAAAVQSSAPDLADKVHAGDMRLSDAKREAERRERERVMAAEAPLPAVAASGRFGVLYVDPPWRYEHNMTDSRAIENQYPTMSLEELGALDINSVAEPASVLFMWATSPKLAEAIWLLAQWGYEYRTNIVWVKDKIGMGYYARQQHELLLIARRGSFPIPAPENRPPSVLNAPRGEHSAKPREMYDLIDAMYPMQEKVELFARGLDRPGWLGWGNEA